MTHIKILITGVAGFICSHLADKYVGEGHFVIGVDNLFSGNLSNIRHLQAKPNFRFVQGDIRDKKLMDQLMRDVDVVINCAAQIHNDRSLTEPEFTYDVNLGGTLVLLQSARLFAKPNVRFIQASTSEIYGSATTFPMTEEHPLNPCQPYGSSKVAADRLCYVYAKVYGMNIAISRSFNVFGQRQKDSGYGGVISIFVRRALAGLPPIIFSDGSQTRDYLWITDAVEAYDCLLKSKLVGECFNFGTGRNLSINKIAELVIKECGHSDLRPVHVDGRPNEVQDLVCDFSKAKKLLGWTPKISFEEGLKMYVDWTKNFKSEQWKLS